MIVRNLRAWNFMRFRRIEITGLPGKGLLGIEGANESGKSTIGHLLEFAVSGRAPRHEGDFTSVINWESDFMKLELDFTAGGKNYRILRQCDRDRSMFVKLESEGGETAQGELTVGKALARILGYKPEEMAGVFMVTPTAVQSLRKPPVERLDSMLGLIHVKRLYGISEGLMGEISSKLDADKNRREKLSAERSGLGYSEEEHGRAEAIKNELDRKQEDIRRELLESRKGVQELKEPYRLLEQEQKHLAEKIEKMELSKLYPELQQHLTELEGIGVQGKAAECLSLAISTLKSILQYRNSIKEFSAKYESQLKHIREKLNLNSEGSAPADSFRRQEEAADRSVARAGRSLSLWARIAIFLALFVSVAVSVYVERGPVLAWMRRIPPIYELDRGKLHGFWVRFKTVFAPNEAGLPSMPQAYFSSASILLMLFISASMAMRARVLLRRRRRLRFEIGRQKETLQDEYKRLLAADFKDMKEVGDIIRRSGIKELKDAFAELKAQNPLLVEKDFDTRMVFRIARNHLDEGMQALNLKIFQMEASVQALEEKAARGQNELSKLLPLIASMEEKKRRTLELDEDIRRAAEEYELWKKENASFGHLVELAKGCYGMLRSRLRFNITALYKQLLPAMTDRRYASVRLDEDFRLMVFSDERGDFVPLSQLSSGTHDLMILLMQLILIHGFAQSRGMAGHFLFLDEPLPALDHARQKRLLDLLPGFSPHLPQIFFCRPPKDAQMPLRLEPSLEKRELVADFSGSAGR